MGLTRRASGAGRATQHCVAGSDPGGGLIRGLRPAATPLTGTEARHLWRNRPREWSRRCTACHGHRGGENEARGDRSDYAAGFLLGRLDDEERALLRDCVVLDSSHDVGNS